VLAKAVAWGVALALYLRFGLEPTGWLFYEASHALGQEWLYWGYTAFRGGGYLLSLSPYQNAICGAGGLLLLGLVFVLGRRGAQ